jgi:SAM-dependent methyltransferase
MTATIGTQEMERAATFDQQRADSFSERLLRVLNDGGLAMMLSVGHRTGLLDTMAKLPAATSQQIADAAGLQERYVREWLGAMVTGLVVEYDSAEKTYKLPTEHAALLTRGGAMGNFAATMQWVSVLGSVEDKIVEKFRHGGGVHYHECHRFHECMAEESAQTVVAGLHEHILPIVPGLIARLEAGIDVLDVGCGSGRALCEMAAAYPRSRFLGVDLCEDTIAAARAEAAHRGLTNARFEVGDDTRLGKVSAFDLVTGFDVVHDQRDPAGLLREIRRVLRPGGVFLCQDIAASSHLEKNIGHPLCPFIYTISTMHCMSVSLAQGGAGLGTCWGEELAVQMFNEAGFVNVEMQTLPHDMQNNYYIMTNPGPD